LDEFDQNPSEETFEALTSRLQNMVNTRDSNFFTSHQAVVEFEAQIAFFETAFEH
jgi:hypothetical protein